MSIRESFYTPLIVFFMIQLFSCSGNKSNSITCMGPTGNIMRLHYAHDNVSLKPIDHGLPPYLDRELKVTDFSPHFSGMTLVPSLGNAKLLPVDEIWFEFKLIRPAHIYLGFLLNRDEIKKQGARWLAGDGWEEFDTSAFIEFNTSDNSDNPPLKTSLWFRKKAKHFRLKGQGNLRSGSLNYLILAHDKITEYNSIISNSNNPDNTDKITPETAKSPITHSTLKPLAKMHFPEKKWRRSSPEETGLNKDIIRQIGESVLSTNHIGLLIKDGMIVEQWGRDSVCEVQSISKSITSVTLGLALRKGFFSGMDYPVIKLYPEFNNPALNTPKNPEFWTGPWAHRITLRHLATMSSGIKTHRNFGGFFKSDKFRPPGTYSCYTNDQFWALARTVTYAVGEDLKTFLQRELLDSIGAVIDGWDADSSGGIELKRNGDKLIVRAGYHMTYWRPSHLARVGHLFLNNGNWNGKQLLPDSFIRESFTKNAIPIVRSWSDKEYPISYGLGWWITNI
ncbi:MAG: serine hydrolase, partial [bacterium]